MGWIPTSKKNGTTKQTKRVASSHWESNNHNGYISSQSRTILSKYGKLSSPHTYINDPAQDSMPTMISSQSEKRRTSHSKPLQPASMSQCVKCKTYVPTTSTSRNSTRNSLAWR